MQILLHRANINISITVIISAINVIPFLSFIFINIIFSLSNVVVERENPIVATFEVHVAAVNPIAVSRYNIIPNFIIFRLLNIFFPISKNCPHQNTNGRTGLKSSTAHGHSTTVAGAAGVDADDAAAEVAAVERENPTEAT